MRRRDLLKFIASPILAASPVKITGLDTHRCRMDGREYLFVEVKTDAGIIGLGEASLPARIQITEEAVRWLEPRLKGLDPAGIEAHWNRLYYQENRWRDGSVLMTALSAIDIALWDIEGKRLGVPVWRLLGGNNQKPMRVYWSHWSANLSPRTPETIAELARKTVAEGWTTVKWVIPRADSEQARLRQVVSEIEAIRKAVSMSLDICLEMYETYSMRSALDLARAVAPLKVMFLEEPVWRESNLALGQIAAQSPVPLAGGEGLLNRWQFRDLLEARGAMIVQPDVIHCGGITEIRKIAALAEVYGAEVAPHMWYGPIGHMASMQSMAGVRSYLMSEWDGNNMRRLHELTGGTLPLVEKGHVTLPDRPGLGLTMDFSDWKRRFPYN
ncbi:mandelate racemase/muconate lactonizing enzyme family protein [Bryobacter aggregatus]|uniref:mandelate racemase/muconate lactonizing enzyme family protein n=1 Tax=Bryobacter aggregatus TaxID=360054 RepID=UPI0009B5A999|nr:mandelate racemase/muconate lactonizing enzyme family protein [Bryobacter aggregatus]